MRAGGTRQALTRPPRAHLGASPGRRVACVLCVLCVLCSSSSPSDPESLPLMHGAPRGFVVCVETPPFRPGCRGTVELGRAVRRRSSWLAFPSSSPDALRSQRLPKAFLRNASSRGRFARNNYTRRMLIRNVSVARQKDAGLFCPLLGTPVPRTMPRHGVRTQ